MTVEYPSVSLPLICHVFVSNKQMATAKILSLILDSRILIGPFVK